MERRSLLDSLPQIVHEPLISMELFEAARARRSANVHAVARKPRRTPRPYLLRGLLRCGMCERRMQWNWNHEEAYYRCRYPQDYASPETLEHASVVYLREAHVIPPFDSWISTLLHPEASKRRVGRSLTRASQTRRTMLESP